MGFQVVSSTPHLCWCPVDYGSAGDTLYVGQLVQSTGDGVAPLGAATGAYDTTDDKLVFGVVVGTNNGVTNFDSTYSAEKITSVSSQADLLARDCKMQEGPWGKGDYQTMVQVAIIDSTTILRGPIRNGAIGTLMSVETVDSASTTGLGISIDGAFDQTAVADNATVYCRTGANMGLYRIRTDSSNSEGTCAVAFPHDVAVGDTFVSANVRPIGMSKAQLDSESMYVENSAALTSDYYGIIVHKLDLADSGGECVEFRFASVHINNPE